MDVSKIDVVVVWGRDLASALGIASLVAELPQPVRIVVLDANDETDAAVADLGSRQTVFFPEYSLARLNASPIPDLLDAARRIVEAGHELIDFVDYIPRRRSGMEQLVHQAVSANHDGYILFESLLRGRFASPCKRAAAMARDADGLAAGAADEGDLRRRWLGAGKSAPNGPGEFAELIGVLAFRS